MVINATPALLSERIYEVRAELKRGAHRLEVDAVVRVRQYVGDKPDRRGCQVLELDAYLADGRGGWDEDEVERTPTELTDEECDAATDGAMRLAHTAALHDDGVLP